MSYWNSDSFFGELKYFVQSLEDAAKLEMFGQFLSEIGFRFWPDRSMLSELKYKFSNNNNSNSKLYDYYILDRKNKQEDGKPKRYGNALVCVTPLRRYATIYCLTRSYYQSSSFKEEFNGGFVVLLDKLTFEEENNSQGVFKLYLHEQDDYVGYESKRFISKIETYLTSSGMKFFKTLNVSELLYT